MAAEKPTGDQSPDSGDAKLGDTDIISDAKGYLQMCKSADDDNRADALDDLEFLSGDQWPDLVVRQREIERRPCLTINKIPTFLHQVTNDQRMNVPSIKVSPVDSNADVETAEILQGMVRHIEYSSNADVSYDTAVNNAAAIGFGYWRLVTEYESPKSFDQVIRFRRIRNPFTVYFDPTSVEPDGSDQKRCLITERVPLADFKRQYPNAETTTTGLDVGTGDPTNKDWYGADFIRVAEFYRIEYVDDELVELPDGSAEFRSVLEAQTPPVEVPADAKTRPTQRETVRWYKHTVFEVLESTEIKCRWIPVFPCYGDELDIDGKIVRSGIVRNAKDPAQMYNFWMTSATEEVAMRPKTPYIGAEGQFEGYEDDWNDANVKSFSYLEYKPVELNGNLAPAPSRQPMADIPNGMLTMAMHANDNIKATTGLFDSSLGARGNATSGTQERAQQRQGDMANFHYTDNLNRSVRHCGRCIVDMIPHYYDARRVVRIMGEDGKMDVAEVNKPQTVERPNPVTGKMETIETILHDMSVGTYDVTCKAGPSYSTLREEAQEGQLQLAKAWPKLMDLAGDQVIANLDWPGAEAISKRIAKTIPPELREGEDGQEQPAVVQTPKGPIPVEQAAQMLAEMDQQMQQMGQELQAAKSGQAVAQVNAEASIEKARIDADKAVRVAEINAVSASDVAELTGVVKLLVAKLNPPPQLVADASVTGKAGEPAPESASAPTA
jgi:hypothetical protein